MPVTPNYDDDLIVRLPGETQGRHFTTPWYQFLDMMRTALNTLPPLDVTEFGAKMDGSDDTGPTQAAINTLISRGGGLLTIPAGTLSINSVFIPSNAPPIALIGASAASTIIKRRGNLNPLQGLIDVRASNFSISDLTIDGNTTVPTRLQYGVNFNGFGGKNDPYADSLTRNTSLWIHGNTSGHHIYRTMFTHTAGYAVLLDAMEGDINDVDILNCWFYNNRPTLFGKVPADLNYGSWNGGIFAKGSGLSATSGIVDGLLVAQCRFKRNTGNCCWSHLNGLDRLHEDFRLVENYFESCGLDGILVGGVTGGVVSDNVFLRIGYIVLADDDEIGTPRWLQDLNATGLDSSGVVEGIPYNGNSFTSINGGCLDLDSHGHSVISGNVCHVPEPGTEQYVRDKIAICGPTNNGQASYGVNVSNSANTAIGGSGIDIIGNQFINLRAGSIRLFSARDCLVQGNNINAPDDSIGPPISYGPIGPGPNQRANRNKICHNRIYYNPAAPAPCIFEDPSIAPFAVTDVNHVFGNVPTFPPGTLATSFQKDPGSGSPVYADTVWFP